MTRNRDDSSKQPHLQIVEDLENQRYIGTVGTASSEIIGQYFSNDPDQVSEQEIHISPLKETKAGKTMVRLSFQDIVILIGTNIAVIAIVITAAIPLTIWGVDSKVQSVSSDVKAQLDIVDSKVDGIKDQLNQWREEDLRRAELYEKYLDAKYNQSKK